MALQARLQQICQLVIFKVTITDSLGCTYERDLVVLQSITPLNIDTIIKTDVACKGDSTGEITAVVSGGFSTSIAVLMLGNDTIAFQDNILDTVTFVNLSSNNYDFYIFDTVPGAFSFNFGCPEQAQVFVEEPQDVLTSTVNLLDHVICYGDSTGKAISTVQGGQFPDIFAWDNGDSTQINKSLGRWQGVTFTDANNCTLRDI